MPHPAVPRESDRAAYYDATDRKHFGDPGTPGSTFTGYGITKLEDIVELVEQQRGTLDGDDRLELVARGWSDPGAFLPDHRYLLVFTPGVLGVLNSAGLDPATPIRVIRTKPGVACSAVIEVTAKPETDFGVLILDDAGTVVTAFPGPITDPGITDTFGHLEGQTVPLKQIREIAGGDVWLNTAFPT
ncbi:hypothetical protein [Agromyces humi]|uniref:hypothetical protein n=1 Tax=Agromyces humi TaxID=1766800 RepID=UPI001357C3E8|nr:hypothetical protein [Agromyces humi]